MNLNEWSQEIHKNAVEHGWWEKPKPISEVTMLCTCELAEAVEEARAGRPLMYVDDVENLKRITDITQFYGRKPEGTAVEMADCLFRVLDWFGSENIDVEQVMKLKHEYNKTRPYKHGKKF